MAVPPQRFVSAALFVSAFFIVLFPVTDSDIFWHLASGREMVARHALLADDPFSFAPTVHPWINLHWLFQIAVYGIHKVGGLYGLILLKALLFGTVAVLAFGPASGGRRLLRFAVTLFALFQVRWLVLERPVMFTLAFVLIFLVLLERYRASGELKWLLPVLPLQLVWANLQGLSPLGPVTLFCFLAEAMVSPELRSRRKPLALVFGAAALLLLATPYGTDGALYPLTLLHRLLPGADPLYSNGIAENLPLLKAAGHEQGIKVTVLILFHFYLILAWRKEKPRRAAYFIAINLYFFLALLALRNALLFVPVCLFAVNRVLAAPTSGNDPSWVGRLRPIGLAVLAGLIALPLLMTLRNLPAYRGLHGLSPFRFGEGGAGYLAAHPVEGNLFNADRFGGYLIWTRGREKKIYMDGRFMLRPKEVFEEYLNVLDHPERFDDLVIKYDITHALMPVAVFDRFRPLVRRLSESPQWTQVFTDGASVLFVKKN